MDHAQPQLFYRCFSTTSAGELRSGRYYDGHPTLSEMELLREFNKHQIRENTQPTALVSVTNRPLEAVNRALAKYYHYGEAPEAIWIAIIRIPGGENYNRPRHAKKLAQQSRLRNADVFKYEYLFEWEIPLEYVVHRVSVRALLDRDIEGLLGLQNCANGFPSFGYMQKTLVSNILDPHFCARGHWIGVWPWPLAPEHAPMNSHLRSYEIFWAVAISTKMAVCSH
ncbi:hypothetical protein BDV11DRAFT_194294 [Aspergillus similis]